MRKLLPPTQEGASGKASSQAAGAVIVIMSTYALKDMPIAEPTKDTVTCMMR